MLQSGPLCWKRSHSLRPGRPNASCLGLRTSGSYSPPSDRSWGTRPASQHWQQCGKRPEEANREGGREELALSADGCGDWSQGASVGPLWASGPVVLVSLLFFPRRGGRQRTPVAGACSRKWGGSWETGAQVAAALGTTSW